MQERRDEIVAAALELLGNEGAEALSMRRIAERVGIRAASIYKHFPNKDALEAAMISVAFERQAKVFEDADGGLAGIAAAYRGFALENPHLYRLMTERALNRELLAPGAEARAAAPLIEAAGGDADLARAAWAFAHGMTILELNQRFPADADLDAAWSRGVEALSRPRSRG
ncbi:MAG TPA: TetR/AcrR family transcriptional regulator [Thermoleophilaceae bacterium]|nr:TetR/AcrR family transcriptional regulator [Thermoleophilaceae bacterium]